MHTRHFLGVDLGAESGRVMLGSMATGRLALEEIHRFANGPIRTGDAWHWDTSALWRGIIKRSVPTIDTSS